MIYKVIPLIYSANEHFKNTIRFAVELIDEIDRDALHYAVEQVQKRYPYFSVRIAQEGEELVLTENNLPFVITDGEKPVCLSSAESNWHLLAFAWKERTVWIDISHFICDGNGLAPLLKTLLYYYIEARYGTDGIETEGIRFVNDSIDPEEYQYPFPDAPLPNEDSLTLKPQEYQPFAFDDAMFDNGGSYAYHLQIPQQALLKYAKSNDGSPVSFVVVMLYETMMRLFPDTEKDIVFQIPHEYRKALGCPLSHDCLARVFFVKLAQKDKGKSLEMLNTSVRGQIILGGDASLDIASINGMLQLNAYMQTLPLEGKKQAMQGLVAGSINGFTFGVSYTGKVSWGGMERYIHNVYPYGGENEFHGTLGVELFTLGDSFSLCLMQPGKSDVFVQEFMQAFARHGIDCKLLSEERYHLADFALP